MQTKKEEIKQSILEAASDEFMKKGYEQSSLRVIAKKANTTLGNIYHYFTNKEALLVEMLTPTLKNLNIALDSHEALTIIPNTQEEVMTLIDLFNRGVEFEEMNALFDKRIVILLELESSCLMVQKEALLKRFEQHVGEHLNLDVKEAPYCKILIKMFTDCLKQALLENDTMEETRKEFIKLFRFFCIGIISNNK